MDITKLKEQVKAELAEYLSKGNHRNTPERYAILEHIYTASGHCDMDSLYISMKNDGFRVSRATLYNTMELLLDSGLVVKHQFGDNVARYEKAYGNENHDHIICLVCGAVKECKNLNVFTLAEQKKIKRFKVSYYSMYIYGICSKCEKQKRMDSKKNTKTTTTSKKKQNKKLQ